MVIRQPLLSGRIVPILLACVLAASLRAVSDPREALDTDSLSLVPKNASVQEGRQAVSRTLDDAAWMPAQHKNDWSEIKMKGLDNSFLTENHLLAARIRHPGCFFMLDGHSAFVSPDFFYSPMPDGRGLWPISSLQTGEWNTGYISGAEKFRISLTGGGEAGDTHLMELSGSSPGGNRTSFSSGTVQASPLKDLQTVMTFYQNDHLSSRQLALRSSLVGAELGAWYGENIPPLSVVETGVRYASGGKMFDLRVRRGWEWEYSPLSGFPYPWELQEMKTGFELGQFLKISGTRQRKVSTLAAYGNASYETGSAEITVSGYAGNGGQAACWRAGMAVKHRSVFEGMAAGAVPALVISRRVSYPVLLELDHRWERPDSRTMITSTYRMIWEESLPVIRLLSRMEEHLVRGVLFQEVEGRLFNPAARWSGVSETWANGAGAYGETGHYGSGLGVRAGYAMHPRNAMLETALSFARESGTPRFAPDSFFTLSEYVLRSGHIAQDNNIFYQAVYSIFISRRLPQNLVLSLSSQIRQVITHEKEAPELVPSPYLVTFDLEKNLPSNLKLVLVLNRVGPREVHYWRRESGPFKVPAHWENNLSLVQTFLEGRLQLKYTALHFFGEDLLEHPNGNPLRFRILAGIEGRF